MPYKYHGIMDVTKRLVFRGIAPNTILPPSECNLRSRQIPAIIGKGDKKTRGRKMNQETWLYDHMIQQKTVTSMDTAAEMDLRDMTGRPESDIA